MATPPTISPHELVTPPVLRIARAAYAAPLRHDLNSERNRHDARLATAVAATAPYLIAEFLAPLRSYLDDCAFRHVTAASQEGRTAGDTELFHRHRAVGQAYDHAAELLEHHAVTFCGGDPPPTADLTAPGPPDAPEPTQRARDTAEAEPPPMISPHGLVTIHILRIARAGYAAPLRHDFGNLRHRHRARLETAIAAAAPFVVAKFLAPLMNYLDQRFLPAYLAAEEENERAGHTPLYQHHRAVYSAYQDAATLLDRHATTFSGHSWDRRAAEITYSWLYR